MNRLIKVALAAVALSAAAFGCSTPIRAITNTNSAPNGFYVVYWEGQCGFTGCSKGNSHVIRCDVQQDNTAQCVPEQEADKALYTPGE